MSFFLGNSTIWNIKNKLGSGTENFGSKAGISPILAKVFLNRGICSLEKVKEFLTPSLNLLHDPYKMKDMDAAVERITRAINKKEKVLIYGDYDVDGVIAASILYNFFEELGLSVHVYIPDRFEEGYGISDLGVNYILKGKYSLVITVDCGITALAQFSRLEAESKGNIDVIITDHHQCQNEKIPLACAVINPHREGCTYPFKYLCGAGVAFKLVHAICEKLHLGEKYLKYIDLTALATIADLVPLVGENRVLVKFGLKKMTETENIGLNALINESGLNKQKITSYEVAFGLAPRINAAGRMGEALIAVDLFTSKDKFLADGIARKLEQKNLDRQKIQTEVYNEALKYIEKYNLYKDKIIVVAGDSWHHGVIGIVASKVTERYHRPCLIISKSKLNKYAVGSGRSISGFNLFRALFACKDILLKFGGHEMAGGFTLLEGNILEFREKINLYAANKLKEELLLPNLYIDALIEAKEMTLSVAEELVNLEPFGVDNPRPLFLCKCLTVLEAVQIGKGKHLRLKLASKEGIIFYSIGFGMGTLSKYIQKDDVVDIVVNLDVNEWKNTKRLQLIIRDVKFDEAHIAKNFFLYNMVQNLQKLDYTNDWFYNNINTTVIGYDEFVVRRETIAAVYRLLRAQVINGLNTDEIFSVARRDGSKAKLNYFKLVAALYVLNELDLAEFIKGDEQITVKLLEPMEKKSLESSKLFTYLKSSLERWENCFKRG